MPFGFLIEIESAFGGATFSVSLIGGITTTTGSLTGTDSLTGSLTGMGSFTGSFAGSLLGSFFSLTMVGTTELVFLGSTEDLISFFSTGFFPISL